MKTKKLIPMVQFVIERAKKAPLEPYHEANESFVNDVINYATMLDMRITLGMFQGETPLFPNFEIQDDEKMMNFYSGIRVYQFGGKKDFDYVFRKNQIPPKIEELVAYDVFYNER